MQFGLSLPHFRQVASPEVIRRVAQRAEHLGYDGIWVSDHIVIPDSAAEKPVQGKVIAVGKGKILEDGNVRPLDVKVGDKILFGKYSGTEVKVDGDDLVVMREEDVMAIIEGK